MLAIIVEYQWFNLRQTFIILNFKVAFFSARRLLACVNRLAKESSLVSASAPLYACLIRSLLLLFKQPENLVADLILLELIDPMLLDPLFLELGASESFSGAIDWTLHPVLNDFEAWMVGVCLGHFTLLSVD